MGRTWSPVLLDVNCGPCRGEEDGRGEEGGGTKMDVFWVRGSEIMASKGECGRKANGQTLVEADMKIYVCM